MPTANGHNRAVVIKLLRALRPAGNGPPLRRRPPCRGSAAASARAVHVQGQGEVVGVQHSLARAPGGGRIGPMHRRAHPSTRPRCRPAPAAAPRPSAPRPQAAATRKAALRRSQRAPLAGTWLDSKPARRSASPKGRSSASASGGAAAAPAGQTRTSGPAALSE
jgi:hypothetical protein